MINALVTGVFDKRLYIASLEAGIPAEQHKEDNTNQHVILFRLVQNKTAAKFLVFVQVGALQDNKL